MKNFRPLSGGKDAFTLIELLVVIAIIAILAAILFPVFAQAREKARSAACLSNQKQIGLGILMYAQDYDEITPMAISFAAGAEGSLSVVLSPYIMKVNGFQTGNDANNVWHCPDDSLPRDFDGNAGFKAQSYAPIYWWDNSAAHKAAWTWLGNGPGQVGGTMEGRSLAEFNAPASTLLFAEYVGKDCSQGTNRCYVVCPGNGINDSLAQNCNYYYFSDCTGHTIKPLHSNGWNYIFADGHVKWSRPEATVGTSSGGTLSDPHGFWTLQDGD